MYGHRKAGSIGKRNLEPSCAVRHRRGFRRLGIERLEDRRVLSGHSWFAPPPPVYGPVQPPVAANKSPGNYSIGLFDGYDGQTNIGPGSSINSAEAPETGFILSGAPAGSRYSFTVTSSGGGTPVTGSGGIDTGAPQYVSWINVAMLHNGTLTYTVQVTSGSTTSVVTATTNLDQTVPAGYSIQGPSAIVATESNPLDLLIPDKADDTGLVFVNATLGDTYSYTVTSSGGGTPVTGTGTISETAVFPRPKYPGEIIPDFVMLIPMVTGINVSSLPDGTLTFSVTVSNGAGTGAPATATATLTHESTGINDPYGPTLPLSTNPFSKLRAVPA